MMFRNFLSSSVPPVCIAFVDLYKCVTSFYPGEDTPTGARLDQLIEMYLPLIEYPSSTHEPVSIIVITDGAASKVVFPYRAHISDIRGHHFSRWRGTCASHCGGCQSP